MRRIEGFPLWIGNARDARDMRGVHDFGIEAIVDLAIEELPIPTTRELIYLRFPLHDDDSNSPVLLRTLRDTLEAVVGNLIPTLIACSAGMSRSPAIAAVIISQFMGVSPEEALRQISVDAAVDVSPALWKSLLANRYGR